MRGLDPRIHPSSEEFCEEDGWPGQARPCAFGAWYGPGSAEQREERCTASGTRYSSCRRRHAQMIGDPAVEIGQRAGAERLLSGDGLFVATQAAAVGLAGRWPSQRREQPKVD